MSDIPRLSLGNHLISKRRLYIHHGIYIGDNKVIHYSGLSNGLQSGPVVISDLSDFLCGNTFKIISHTPAKFTAAEIKQRAISRLGENLYHPLFNNCEHFVTWCITERNNSKQVNFYLAMTAGLPGYLISKTGSALATFLRKATQK